MTTSHIPPAMNYNGLMAFKSLYAIRLLSSLQSVLIRQFSSSLPHLKHTLLKQDSAAPFYYVDSMYSKNDYLWNSDVFSNFYKSARVLWLPIDSHVLPSWQTKQFDRILFYRPKLFSSIQTAQFNLKLWSITNKSSVFLKRSHCT